MKSKILNSVPKAKPSPLTTEKELDAVNDLDNSLHDCKSLASILFSVFDRPETHDFDVSNEAARATIGIIMDRLGCAIAATEVLHEGREARKATAFTKP